MHMQQCTEKLHRTKLDVNVGALRHKQTLAGHGRCTDEPGRHNLLQRKNAPCMCAASTRMWRFFNASSFSLSSANCIVVARQNDANKWTFVLGEAIGARLPLNFTVRAAKDDDPEAQRWVPEYWAGWVYMLKINHSRHCHRVSITKPIHVCDGGGGVVGATRTDLNNFARKHFPFCWSL